MRVGASIPPGPEGDGSAELLALPFAPGTSPFHIKGIAYRGHLQYVEERLRGGIPAMLDALDDEHQRRFFDVQFLGGSWYDVFPLAVAGIACGRLSGQGYLGFVRSRSMMQAELDSGGVYRYVLKLVSAEMVAERVPRLVAQYTDFARIEYEQSQGGHVRGRHVGIPRPLAPWWRVVTDAYLRVLLSRAGATHATVSYAAWEPCTSAHGIQCVDMPFTANLQR